VPLRRTDWEWLPETLKGSIFLLSLVLSATMMPVEKLPAASVAYLVGTRFRVAVFDNIPSTALALKQGGYDWATWPTPVASRIDDLVRLGAPAWRFEYVSRIEVVGRWLIHGWHVSLAYVLAFLLC